MKSELLLLITVLIRQICVAPDYVLCHPDIQKELIDWLKETVLDFYGEVRLGKSANFCFFVCFNFANLSEIPSLSLSNVCDTILSNIKLLRHEHLFRFQNHRCRGNALWSVEYFASSLFVFLDIVHQLTDACFFSLVIGRKESAGFNYISYDRLSTLLSRSIYEESTVQWLVAICYGC